MKAIFAALSLVCVSATPAENPIGTTQYPLVHQVVCDRAKGTAFRIGPTTFLSVAHVTSNTGCTIDGYYFTARNDGESDFSILDVPSDKLGGFKINCDGFIPGEWYYAIGYAQGLPWQQTVTILATYVKIPNGMRLLLGSPTVIPGMSGGPVINSRGEVVGTVNMYTRGAPLSYSRALRDTEVCRNA